jgi:hypothetical protein
VIAKPHLVEWALSHGLGSTKELAAYAAGGGHLQTLRWLRDNDCPWDACTVAAAVRNGHKSVEEWALANGCPEYLDDACGKCKSRMLVPLAKRGPLTVYMSKCDNCSHAAPHRKKPTYPCGIPFAGSDVLLIPGTVSSIGLGNRKNGICLTADKVVLDRDDSWRLAGSIPHMNAETLTDMRCSFTPCASFPPPSAQDAVHAQLYVCPPRKLSDDRNVSFVYSPIAETLMTLVESGDGYTGEWSDLEVPILAGQGIILCFSVSPGATNILKGDAVASIFLTVSAL